MAKKNRKIKSKKRRRTSTKALTIFTKPLSADSFAEAQKRLTSIKVSNDLAPKERPDPNFRGVGEVSDLVKRLYTLREELDKEIKVLTAHVDTLTKGVVEQLKKGQASGSLREISAAFNAIADVEEEPGYRAALAKISMVKDLYAVVSSLLLLQMRLEFPELAGKAYLDIRANWIGGWVSSQANASSVIAVEAGGHPHPMFELMSRMRPAN